MSLKHVPGSAEISFCMIVRNGAATLSTCLDSVVKICDELIVVDSGSDDESPSIARSYGASVLHVPWKGDFSALRNVYLEKVRCPWVLSLDADEVLGDVKKSDIQSWLSGHESTGFIFSIRNYFFKNDNPEPVLPTRLSDEVWPGVGCIITKTVRLFPNHPGVRYCFPVHESLQLSLRREGIRLRACKLPIHHMGYLYRTQQDKRKAALYKELGLKKVAQYPNYPLGYLELGRVCLHDGDLKQAEHLFSQTIRLRRTCVEAQCYLGLTLLRQGRLAECRRQLQRTIQQFPGSSEAVYLLEMLEQRVAQRDC